MRLVFVLVAVLAAGSALAQSSPDQPKRPISPPISTERQTNGLGVPDAPIGHLQPKAADLPPEVRDVGATPTPQQQEFDKKLRICRGC